MYEENTRTRMLKYMVRAKGRIESECKLVKKISARIGKSLLGAISPEVRTELQCHPMYRYNIWLDPFALLKLLGDVSIRFRDDNPMIKAQRQISIENQVRSFKLEANESTLDCLTRYTHLIRECEMRGADLPDPMKQVIIFSNAMKEASRGVTYTKDADDSIILNKPEDYPKNMQELRSRISRLNVVKKRVRDTSSIKPVHQGWKLVTQKRRGMPLVAANNCVSDCSRQQSNLDPHPNVAGHIRGGRAVDQDGAVGHTVWNCPEERQPIEPLPKRNRQIKKYRYDPGPDTGMSLACQRYMSWSAEHYEYTAKLNSKSATESSICTTDNTTEFDPQCTHDSQLRDEIVQYNLGRDLAEANSREGCKVTPAEELAKHNSMQCDAEPRQSRGSVDPAELSRTKAPLPSKDEDHRIAHGNYTDESMEEYKISADKRQPGPASHVNHHQRENDQNEHDAECIPLSITNNCTLTAERKADLHTPYHPLILRNDNEDNTKPDMSSINSHANTLQIPRKNGTLIANQISK